MARTNYTEKLTKLGTAAAAERAALRDLEATTAAKQQAHDQARGGLVEAYASQSEKDIKAAKTNLARSVSEAEDLVAQVEGAKLRVRRAEQDRQTFEAQHTGQLLRELEPDAQAVTDRLAAAAAELVAAHRGWHAVHDRAGALLVADPGASPRDDMIGDHPLAGVVRDLRAALAEAVDIPPPLPHWRGRDHQQDSERRNRLLRLSRKPDQSDDDLAEIAHLREQITTTGAAA